MTTILPFEEEIRITEEGDHLVVTLGMPDIEDEGEGYQFSIGRARALEIAQVLSNWADKQPTT